MIRVLLADKHTLLHPGIRSILDTTEEIILIDTFTCYKQLIQHCHIYQPDVILLALNVVDSLCADTFNAIQEQCIAAKTLILLQNRDQICLQKLMKFGVAGVIYKSDMPEALIRALYAIASGQIWYSQVTIASMTADTKTEFTEREHVILQLVVAEKTDREIAQDVNLSERAVRKELRRIYDKLEVNCRAGAAYKAGKQSLV